MKCLRSIGRHSAVVESSPRDEINVAIAVVDLPIGGLLNGMLTGAGSGRT